jgi:ferritin-like protein
MPSTSRRIASGWSPAGGNGWQAPRTARELDHPALQFVNLGHRLPACLFMETPENPDETGPGIRVLLRALRCNIKSP